MRRLFFPLLLGICGLAVLVSLGVWQIQRLSWKEAILDRIETRLAENPLPLPDAVDAQKDKYLAVTVQGHFDTGVVRMLSGQKHVGPGYMLISPFETVEGRRLLIDRGFIPLRKDTPEPPTGDRVVTGNLLWPDERTSSTPENDLSANIWFARDVVEMAEHFETEPVLIVARTLSTAEEDVTPVPVNTKNIPNDHLSYAITWFSLAFIWLVMTIYFIRRQSGQTKRT